MILLDEIPFAGSNVSEFLHALGITFGILCFVALVAIIFFILTLQETLQEVSVHNRKTSPANAWLLLIPLFNLVWNFMMIDYIADSLRAEFNERNISVNDARPGYIIGLVMSIMNCCTLIPTLGIIGAVGSLVSWILYWIKITQYKRLIRYDKIMKNLPPEPGVNE